MIIDLIKSFQPEQVAVTSFSVGTFKLDCQLEESHESNLVTTENPMESGAKSSDHSCLENKRYAVRGLVTSYEPFNFVADRLQGNSIYDAVKTLPLPLGVGAVIDQAEATLNRYAGKVLQNVNVNSVSNWLPSSLGMLGDESETTSRYEKIYSDLLTIQASGEPLTITTTLRTYTNMKLINVIANKGVEDVVEVSLTFKEEINVETQTVSGLVVNVPQVQTQNTANNPNNTPSKPEAPKTGRSADQSAKPKSKGKTQPKEENKSIIYGLLN